ncbi:uncharacterized protein LOC121941665 [Plectropomus leopardus]|uniref:uncharacterized protein LOC121941665 n=1 Tax=Plectropomus leopardus TaxID=160734 RepID=UPI001C4CD1A9|nr:uncharacterized protein LOC121941665 [Plectropomus leopardus]
MKTISVFYCLLYAVVIEGADIYAEGLEGGEVSFRCSHRLAWKNDKYLCKDLCKGKQDILVTVQSGGRAVSGRITLVDTGDGVFTVTFSQLQLSDVGRYWCSVDRPGLDTFTAVHLTVKEALPNETTTVISNLESGLPTLTYQNISNSTELPSEVDTSGPANLSTASNSTNGGGQNTSTGAELYATIGVVAVLTILMLAVIIRNCRETLNSQPQVCSNSKDLSSADVKEVDCEYDDIGGEVQLQKKISKRLSCTHQPKQDPATPASSAAECNASLHIYENISCAKGTAHSRCSATNNRGEHDPSSGIYIKPLPPLSERAAEGCLKSTATTSATSQNTESCTSKALHFPSRSDSTEVKPRSLWFGLDLSGVV